MKGLNVGDSFEVIWVIKEVQISLQLHILANSLW